MSGSQATASPRPLLVTVLTASVSFARTLAAGVRLRSVLISLPRLRPPCEVSAMEDSADGVRSRRVEFLTRRSVREFHAEVGRRSLREL